MASRPTARDRNDGAVRHATAAPTIQSPAAIRGWRLDLGEERFAVVEWAPDAAAPEVLRRLTDAESSVVRLVCAGPGASYAAVAAARGVSPRTVAKQLASAFRKLGVRSRAELCALLASGERGA